VEVEDAGNSLVDSWREGTRRSLALGLERALETLSLKELVEEEMFSLRLVARSWLLLEEAAFIISVVERGRMLTDLTEKQGANGYRCTFGVISYYIVCFSR
jgi:hypothetical protein